MRIGGKLLPVALDVRENFFLLIWVQAPDLASMSPADEDVACDVFKHGVRLKMLPPETLVNLGRVSWADVGIVGFEMPANFLPGLLETDGSVGPC